MNDDEQLIDRLRTMAGPFPEVRVDRDAVLRRGRRRRAARASGVTLGVGVLCAGLYLGAVAPGWSTDGSVAPATSDSTSRSPEPEGGSAPSDDEGSAVPRAVVDEATGKVVLPLDEWNLTPEQWAAIDSARDVYVARCLSEAGYGADVELVGPVPAEPWHGRPYGVWHLETLERVGYALPRLESPNHVRAESEAGAAQERVCGREALERGMIHDRTQLEGNVRESHDAYLHAFDDEGEAVLAEWRQCLQDAGVEPPREGGGMLPADARGASLDQQVRIGRVDIACKERLDVVQRLADLDAAAQAEYIERARDYLEERRAVEQAALATSEDYLAEQGLSMDDATW